MLRWRSESLKMMYAVLVLGGTLLPSKAQVQQANQGAQRFVEYCAGCHGADARGGDKAPPLISPSRVAASEEDAMRVVRDGTAQGMPPFAQIGEANITAVVHYLRVLQGESADTNNRSEPAVPGDPNLGRELFFGKAQCSACHMMQGRGGFVASGLTTYGRNRLPESIIHAITNPDDPLARSSRVVNLTTRGGQRMTGVLRNEDAFTVEVQTEDGRFQMLSRSDLAEIQYTEHSLMPRDYATRLTSKELNDIVSFLIVAARDEGKGTRQGN
jgi:cytochrome c oxidase cbb3-type subunit 3